jgi:hypothetical protein
MTSVSASPSPTDPQSTTDNGGDDHPEIVVTAQVKLGRLEYGDYTGLA